MEKFEVVNIKLPQYKGSYYIGSYHIMFEHKPVAFHRFFMRVLLGFKWKDNE